MTMLMSFLLLFLLVWLLISFSRQFYNIIWRNMAPFIITSSTVINHIVAHIEIKDNMTVMELGCGDAPFLWAVKQKNPHTRLIGVEYFFWPWCLAKFRFWRQGVPAEIRKADINKTDISEADIIYCYLRLGTMAKLEAKFCAEAKPGCLIISYNFPLPNTKALRVQTVGNKAVYFYSMGQA